MSINAINYVANLRRRVNWTPTKKVIFWHLCDQANSDTWSWEIVSHEDLAEKADTTIRSVYTAIKDFEAEGILTYRPNVGRRGQKTEGFHFTIHPEALDAIMQRPADWNQRPKQGPTPTAEAQKPGSENISDPTGSLWITGSENISDPANSGSEEISDPTGSEKNDTDRVENFRSLRAHTSLSHSETIHSSSSPPGPVSGDESSEPLTRREDEMKLSDDQTRPVADAYGTAHPVYTHPTHGTVRLVDIQQALQAISTEPVSVETAESFAQRILERGTAEPKRSATAYVVGAIRGSASRSRYDLAAVVGTAEDATPEAEGSQARSMPCPIPAHANLGHRQHRCPDCRDLTGAGDFPEAVSQSIFEALSPEGQASLARYGVPIHGWVDQATLERTVSWGERDREHRGRVA